MLYNANKLKLYLHVIDQCFPILFTSWHIQEYYIFMVLWSNMVVWAVQKVRGSAPYPNQESVHTTVKEHSMGDALHSL